MSSRLVRDKEHKTDEDFRGSDDRSFRALLWFRHVSMDSQLRPGAYLSADFLLMTLDIVLKALDYATSCMV
jgi:hypothetical protein